MTDDDGLFSLRFLIERASEEARSLGLSFETYLFDVILLSLEEFDAERYRREATSGDRYDPPIGSTPT